MTALVECQNVIKSFNVEHKKVEILHNVSFTIPKGSFTILFGPSGSGKTTILNTILGLEPPTSGALNVDGVDLYSLSSDERSKFRSHYIGVVHQSNYWVNSLSVLDNVALPLYLAGHSKGSSRKLAKQSLERIRLEKYSNRPPTVLSGGEQQRISVARAMVKNPEIIIADEPTGNLDTSNGNEIMGLLNQFNKELNTTVVLVTHNPDFLQYSNNIIGIRDGVVEQQNTFEGESHD